LITAGRPASSAARERRPLEESVGKEYATGTFACAPSVVDAGGISTSGGLDARDSAEDMANPTPAKTTSAPTLAAIAAVRRMWASGRAGGASGVAVRT
jgi:hypothetical protein